MDHMLKWKEETNKAFTEQMKTFKLVHLKQNQKTPKKNNKQQKEVSTNQYKKDALQIFITIIHYVI